MNPISSFQHVHIGMVVAVVLGLSLAGCLTGSEVADCEFYPDVDYMIENWNSRTNQTAAGWDPVSIEIQHWWKFDRDNSRQEPEFYVDWAKFPVEDRPEILVDILCMAYGNFLNGSSYPAGLATAPESEGSEIMTALRDEHIRQTGERGWMDACCIILFKDEFWGAGCRGIHGTTGQGHAVTRCEY